MIRARVSRALLGCAVAAGAWAAWVWFTGGFAVRVAGMRLSSTRAAAPAVVGLLAALGAWWSSTQSDREALAQRFRSALVSPPTLTVDGFADVSARTASRLAAMLAIAICVVGIWRGAPYAGGSDAYGYVSQAELWLHGSLRVEEPLMQRLSWPYAKSVLPPIGYVASANGHSIVPIYPPGLPLVMAPFQWVGGRHAVFLVVPLLAAIAVWITFLLGRRLGGSLVGLVAAALVAASPVFVFQVMVPMGDVPAASWWALCLLLSTFTSRRVAFGAGAAAAIAVLTRPNLVPLAIVPAAMIAARPFGARVAERAGRVAAFAAAGSVGAVFLAAFNWRLYGSPLVSGYGAPSNYFAWHYFWKNAAQYSTWFVQAETAVPLLALSLPAVLWWARPQLRRDTLLLVAGLVLFVVDVAACYAWYEPMDAWFLLRYFLPMYPPFMVLAAMALVGLAVRLIPPGATTVVTIVVLLVMWHHLAFLEARGGFSFRENERKVPAVSEYIASQLPDNAVLLAEGFSGSIRYYTGRMTVRHDWIPPDQLDRSIADLRALGLHPYIVVDEREQESFRKRFMSQSAYGALDWPPVAWLRHSTRVYIYDPGERDHSSGRASTVIMP